MVFHEIQTLREVNDGGLIVESMENVETVVNVVAR